MTTKTTSPISDLLRHTIADSEMPLLTIEQETGVKRQSYANTRLLITFLAYLGFLGPL